MAAHNGDEPLFGIDDDMSRVMAAHDWSAAPVGPPGAWPPLLQTMVRILVTSRFSMWLGWGPELSFFYNQAYARDTLNVKHPWALGRPAREVWSEIWGDIGPRIDRVMSTGQATWDEALLLFLERSGYREETYHTFSYSPMSDSEGTVVGLLCVVSEDTKRVIAERRMATLRDLSAALSSARTEAEVFTAVSGELAGNPQDLPFALTYTLTPEGRADLVAATGVAEGHRLAPASVVSGDGSIWPLAQVWESGHSLTVDLSGAGDARDIPCGAWEDPPRTAVLVPLTDGSQSDPTGVFVAGINPYREYDGDYQGFVELVAGGIGSGLASARAYEAERRRAESLAELDRAKTEFFSNVSHEFRTPLTLIIAPVDDALNDDVDSLPAAQRNRLHVIQRNAWRLRRLVNDMLDFARIEGGRLHAETVPTDLSEYTRDLALSFAPAFERAGLRFDLDLRPLGRPVNVDPDMWEKIVLNLLSNALKFTLDGGVTLALSPGGADEAQLSVSDTGVGIAPEYQERLFERFYRAPRPAARSHEGTGIGLALVAELTRLHGGSVSVSSREGEGSTFTVRVPFGSAAPGATAGTRESSLSAYLDEALQWSAGQGNIPDASSAAHTSVVGRTGQAAVLVVDDNPDMRSYLVKLLEPFWDVRAFSDGLEALDAIRADLPDLVLTDVMMPRLDGFGLLTALRSDPATATIPVVFLSARAGEDAAVEGLEAGADDYLVKPFSGLELLARVRSNLELAALRNREAAWRSALVDSLQDGVAVIDATGQVTEVNPAFEEITGYPRSALPFPAPYPWMIDGEPALDGTSVEEIGARILAGDRLSAIIPVRHRLGHRLQVAIAASSVGDGDHRRVVVAFHDVTAELAASERDAALARMGIRLAEASDVAEVHEAGITELRRAFGARRACVLTRRDKALVEDAAAGEGQPLAAEDAARIFDHAGEQTVVISGAGAGNYITGMGATLDPRDGGSAVWLDFGDGRPVGTDERALFAVLCGYFGQSVRRAQLFDDSRTVATAMQRSILGPTEVPPEIAVRYFPAIRPLEVGGDWYDVVALDDRRLGVVVGDCTGRGLDAATTMGQLRSACRAVLLQAKGPGEVIASLDTFAERLPGALCTTVFCGVIDTDSGAMVYSSAGHLPAFVVEPDGQSSMLDRAQGVPLGYQSGVERPEAEADLPPGSTLLLYTDGLVERRRESLDVGFERLRAALVDRRDQGPEELVDGVLGTLVAPGGHNDDIALLAYRRPGPGLAEAPFRAAVRSDGGGLSDFRRHMRAWLAANEVPPDTVDEVLIATGEAVANSIEHAHGFAAGGSIDVSMTCRGGVLSIEVADGGSWREGDSEENRGRGLAIMRALVEALDVIRTPAGTTVRMTKRVGP